MLCEHMASYTIRSHSFTDVHPFEGSGYIRDRKGEWIHLFCSSRGSALSVETSIKSVMLVWYRGGNVHSSWFVPSKTCYVVDALPHASCVVVVELFFNFVFVLSFVSFDGSPEIVTGLFPIVSVSGFKGRCPRWQGWSNIAVNPRFLVWVDADCFCRNYVFYTLPDENTLQNLNTPSSPEYVIIRRCPEHVPVHLIKTVL